jgi:hypothetical protein
MKKRASFALRWILVLLVCLGTFAVTSPASNARNQCKDRCKERYNLRKDVCKAIPYKSQRHSCENAAKRARDECKHRCR